MNAALLSGMGFEPPRSVAWALVQQHVFTPERFFFLEEGEMCFASCSRVSCLVLINSARLCFGGDGGMTVINDTPPRFSRRRVGEGENSKVF